MGKRIVIIGAGYAGILTAKKLAKEFKKDKEVDITLIDRNPFHTMLTELHEVAANRVEEDSIKISLKKVFEGRKVNLKLDTVESIDFDKNEVCGRHENYKYDYLVLAAGSRPAYYEVEGAENYSYKLWSYEDAVVLKDHIHDVFRKAAAETDPDERKKLLTFYVVGAGFTGVEMIGELAEYVPVLCEQFEIDRKEVSLCVVDLIDRIIPTLPEKLSDKAQRRLEKMGVKVKLKTNVTKIGPDFIETETNGVKTSESCSTVIWAAGIKSAKITEKASKVLQSAKGGRIKVDSYLRALDRDNVYVIGDNMFYIPPGEESSVPQMVENCEKSADVAAHNIACAISGNGSMLEYRPTFHGVMVSIGGRYGVARVGFGKKMLNLPSFFAMFVKHFINMVYFAQVLGWHKIFSYMKHEFFTIRNARSFVGGHFTNRTPSFLLVPLRIWLGLVWIFEGVKKIFEGWLTSPKLDEFFGGAQQWYNTILSSAAGGAAAASDAVTTQAVSSATPQGEAVVQSVGTVLFNLDFGIFQAVFVSGKELINSTISDYAFKLNIPLLDWFIKKFILPYGSVQILAQAVIVIAEILIGLALVGGLFTFISSAFSLVLQAMFVATTGLYLSTFWMIFAAIALLFGAGRTFGLDYYVMPSLAKLWKRIPFVRKWYIYND